MDNFLASNAWEETRDPLFSSARKMAFVLENLKDHAIFLVDAEGSIVSWNPGSERVFGFSDSETLGKPFATIFTPEDVQAGIPEKELAIARTEGKAEDERWHQRKDGTRFWASGAVVHVPGEKGESQYIKVVRDATDRKRSEDADRMESIGRLAGGVAHDYNNMLTSIIGFCELLAASLPKDNYQQEWVAESLSAANRAAVLTRDLLAFSRRQMIAPTPTNLNDILKTLQGRLRKTLGERVQLLIEPDPDLEMALLDQGQIEQVLLNLALNAREAMPEGGTVTLRTLSAKATALAAHGASHAGAATAASTAEALNAASAASGRRILAGPSGEASEAESRDYLTLTFADDGKGMDEETSAHAFDPFFSTKAKAAGSVGMGLSTAYGIIQQSGGTISLSSVPDSGTVFEIHLPIQIQTDRHDPHNQEASRSHPVPAEARTPPSRPSREGKPKETILLVEDENAVRKLASQVLRSRGFEVLEAGDGEEGWAIFHSRPDAIDTVVTDLVMPKMGGLALARKILSRQPDVPILFMSGYSEDPLSDLNMPHRNCAFLQKPFSIASLLEKVDGARNRFP